MDLRWRALAVLTMARTAMGFQFQSVPSVSTGLMHDLALDYADLGLLVGLYFLPGVFVSIPAGLAGPRYGDKRVVLAGLVLMVGGGLLTASAPSAATLALGRALSGVGAVLLNVLMSKMVTDWFAGRELPLAMSIFINSFPVGIGLALVALGSLVPVHGWRTCLAAAAVFPAAAFLLVAGAYRPHANERVQASQGAQAFALGLHHLVLLCLAGAMWGALNGAFAIMTSFSPAHLVRTAGLDAAHAATVVGASTWAVVLSVQMGIVAHRWNRSAALMAIGCLGWAFCALAAAIFPAAAAPALVVAGLVLGLPIGLILALPGQILAPSQRALGMGIFYLWLYLGHGTLPPLAGWVQDRLAATSASLVIVGVLALAILGLYGLFCALSPARSKPAAPLPSS
jgi:predicted MFS family arabinose efflux permease